jgi:hypothetical protein
MTTSPLTTPPARMITLLTDFGQRDPFVGLMRAAIARIDRGLTVIDLTHAIDPQAVEAGAFWLERSFAYLPEGTVHVAVVDPGVGTTRRPIAVRAAGHSFVGPDNGLLAGILGRDERAETREIDPRHGLGRLSRTFHGRDLFAPAAARLAAGLLDFADLGPVVEAPAEASWRGPRRGPGWAEGHVKVVDAFGNLLTDLDASWASEFGPEARVAVGGRSLRMVGTYGEAPPGELVALINAFDVVEIAMVDGDAARALGLGRGAPVRLG